MTDLARYQTQIAILKAAIAGNAEAEAALRDLNALVDAELRRHPVRIGKEQRARERARVEKLLQSFRKSDPSGSPNAWLSARTGYPIGRIRSYLRAIRASCADLGQSRPKSPEIAP